MALGDYVQEKASVAFPGGEFEVRGLGVADLSVLFSAYLDDMEIVSQILTGQIHGRMLSETAGIGVAMDLVRQAPNFVAATIAIAADEPGMIDRAGKLPLHAQVAALSAVGRLTFQDVAGLGNILTALLQTAGGLAAPAEGSSRAP